MNIQRVAAVARQVIAYAALVVGPLTAAVPAMHLPAPVSAVITAVGGVIVVVEHYVGDPSTGTTTAALPAPGAAPGAPTPTGATLPHTRP